MERFRIFVALTLPASVLDAVVAWQRSALDGRQGLRAIRREALHLTLSFLGERDPDEVEGARVALASVMAEPGPVAMTLGRQAIGLPRRRPRVVAFEAPSPAATRLQEELAARLIEAGLLEPERRPYRPHLSVARVRGDPGAAVAAGRGGPHLEGLPPLPERAGHTFDAVRVALYRSELRSQGARYSSLADFDLPRSGG